jgi:hypothetical protein
MTALQPNDITAEQCVLGGMLLSVSAIAEVTTVIGPRDYYRPAHGLIHEAIIRLHDAGQPTDIVAAKDDLERHGVLGTVGGGTYLHTLIETVPAAVNAAYYAQIIAGHSERRQWIEHASRIRQAAENPGADLATVRQLAGQQPDTSRGGLLAGLRNGAWLARQTFPPLQYAVPGVIPEGSTLLIGAPKIGKSWLVLACGLAIASGGVALSGIKTDPPRPVLYLALEDSDRRLQDRCRQLLDDGTIPEKLDYLTRVEPGRIIPTVADWLRQHNGDRPAVIVDTLGKVMPPAIQGESAYQRDYRIGSELKALADACPGSSLLVNHHERKAASSDFIDSVSGTHGLAGAADTIILLTRDRTDSNGLLQVTGRDIPEGEYALSFTAGVWGLDGDGLDDAASTARVRRAAAGLSGRSIEVITYAERHPEGVRAAQVAVQLGISEHTARTYLARLADGGHLAKQGRGLYTPVASVALLRAEGSDDPAQRNNATDATRLKGTPCQVCGNPLDSALAAAGDTTHPACDPGGDR